MGRRLCVVKIGGSVITDTATPKKALTGEIRRLLKEIDEAGNAADTDVIIGHGGGSFPHIPAKRYRVSEGLINGKSMEGALATLRDARELNTIVISEGLELGVPLFPFSASSFTLSEDGRITTGLTEQIREALSRGFMPLVYGDVGIDTRKGVCILSTEEILRFLAIDIKPVKVVFGTDVDGVFDKDPKGGNARIIREIDHNNIGAIGSALGTTRKVDVTGGMRTKVALLHEIVKMTGATGYIVNASRPNAVRDAILGAEERCTIVRP